MKTILVPTDFSNVSVNAALFAADMAKSINAELLVCNAYQLPVTLVPEGPASFLSPEDMKKESEVRLIDLVKTINSYTSNEVKIQWIAMFGETVDQLEKICSEVKPFIVVMGAKSNSRLANMLLGSTTLSAIRHLTWPVIAVSSGRKYGNGIRKIGFACDFREVSKTTPTQAIHEIVKGFHAELHILTVDHHDKHFNPGTVQESFDLHHLFSDLDPIYHYIDNPDAEDGISEFAAENNLDLIIAIPKKHKLFEGIFKPSSTRQLIAQSPVPIMCLHE